MLVFYLNVAYVCNDFQLFFQVFHMHVSNVLSVAFKCFKSISGVAHGYVWEAVGGMSGPHVGDVQVVQVTQA
jgi:hypothetical protein